ncbi:MAG: pimeloyl-ACP methyl ester carboxylesterase [Candidatus Azotimanducaceae bacterium]|jgi:pimeloyl-ACP methyl ester carboxylesterase
MSQDAAELLEQLDTQNIRVVGWSDGRVTGLDLAMNNRGLVSKLVIFGSNFYFEGLIPDELSDAEYSADG